MPPVLLRVPLASAPACPAQVKSAFTREFNKQHIKPKTGFGMEGGFSKKRRGKAATAAAEDEEEDAYGGGLGAGGGEGWGRGGAGCMPRSWVAVLLSLTRRDWVLLGWNWRPVFAAPSLWAPSAALACAPPPLVTHAGEGLVQEEGAKKSEGEEEEEELDPVVLQQKVRARLRAPGWPARAAASPPRCSQHLHSLSCPVTGCSSRA